MGFHTKTYAWYSTSTPRRTGETARYKVREVLMIRAAALGLVYGQPHSSGKQAEHTNQQQQQYEYTQQE